MISKFDYKFKYLIEYWLETCTRYYILRIFIAVMGFTSTYFEAGAQNTFTDFRKPAVVWDAHIPQKFVDSSSEAIDVTIKFLQDDQLYDYLIDRNAQPCPTSTSIAVWGTPVDWCTNVTVYYKGSSVVFQPTTFQAIMTALSPCAADYATSDSYLSPLEMTLNGITLQNIRRVCTKEKLYIKKHECGLGNPIFPNRKSKLQSEIDYSVVGKRLSLVRDYNSLFGKFNVSFNLDFLAPVQAAFSSCLYGYVNEGGQKLFRCFEAVNPFPGNRAIFTNADGARDELSWDGATGTSLLPMFKNRLLPTTVNGGSGWMLVDSESNDILSFDGDGKLAFINYLDGQSISLFRNLGVLKNASDNWGRALTFGYDADVLLSYVKDPSGQLVNYTYYSIPQSSSVTSASSSKPATVVYQDASFKSYTWDEPPLVAGDIFANRLTGIIDESGKRYASFGYINGDAVSTEHAGGVEKFVISDNRVSGVGTITLRDPLMISYETNYGLIKGLSEITSGAQPAGSGCSASSSAMAYDGNGNVTQSDDFDAHRSCMAYDASNREVARVEGLAASASTPTCGTYTAANAALAVGSRKTSTQWHPLWRLATQVAEPGRLTTSVYNGQPDPFNGGATASCVTPAANLPDGSPIAVLCKRVEQSTTDVDGHLGFTAALQPGVVNRVSSWTYNQYGQVLTSVDALGNTTTSTYWGDTSFAGADPNAVGHTVGDLKTVTNAANKVTLYDKYDKNGQLLQSTDANSVLTINTYDARQRLKTTSVGGQLTTYDYWPTGLLKKVTQPDTSFIAYGYDDAHRLTTVSDNLNNTITYTLDNAGNRTVEETRDPGNVLRRQLTRSMDALSRVQQTTGVQ